MAKPGIGDGRNEPVRNKRTIWLLAIGAFLVIQLPFAAMSQPQPYPAFILPGFREVAVNGEGPFERVEISIHYADGTVIRPEQREFFPEFNYSSIPGTIEFAFGRVGDGAELSASVQTWAKTQAARLYVDAEPTELELCWRSSRLDIDTLALRDMRCAKDMKVEL